MQNKGKITFLAAVLLTINTMVGAGILTALAPITSVAGNVSFLGWPLIGLLILPVVYCVAKAAQLFPGDGGFYHYSATGISPLAGVISQWGCILGYLSTAAAILCVLRNGFVDTLGFSFVKEHPIIFNAMIASFYTIINTISLSKISKIQSIATIVKVMPIVTIIALMAFYFDAGLQFNFQELANIGVTISTVMFAYFGFESACSVGGLLKDGSQKVAKVILTGFFLTIALYAFFHLGLLYIMGADNLAAHGAIAFPRFLGLSPAVETAVQFGIAAAILFSLANSILGFSMANITNIHSLACNRMVLADSHLASVNNAGRPAYAAVAHGLVLFALITFITDMDVFFVLTNFGLLISFVLTLTAVFGAHLKSRNYVQLFITILGYGACVPLLYYSWMKIPNPLYLIPLVLGVLFGVVMFKIQQSRQNVELVIAE